MNAITLGYHDINDHCGLPPHKRIYILDRSLFRAHLTAISKSMGGQPIHSISSFENWDEETRRYLTFDDGCVSGSDFVADELESRGWRGHFFIVTDWLTRPGYLRASQIRELDARGHIMGSHTCSHPEFMSALSWSQLKQEWSASCAALADILGKPVRVASVANGFCSRKVCDAAAESGIEVLFTSSPTARVRTQSGCLVIGRFFQQHRTPAAEAAAFMSGRLTPRIRQQVSWRLKSGIKAIAGEHYLQIRHRLLSAGKT